MKHTLMIRNMRSTQNISISCGVSGTCPSDPWGIPEAMGEENTFCHGESFVENISDRIVFMLNNRVEQPLRPCFSWEETAKIENSIYTE